MNSLLQISLDAAVPLRIMAIKASGGPSEDDLAECRDFSRVLGERGDVLLYRSSKAGESAEMFNRLAQALAVLAFCPGGVKAFERHWRA